MMNKENAELALALAQMDEAIDEYGKSVTENEALEQTNAVLLEALENLLEDCEHNNPLPSTMLLAAEAIRKAKSHADTLKGE